MDEFVKPHKKRNAFSAGKLDGLLKQTAVNEPFPEAALAGAGADGATGSEPAGDTFKTPDEVAAADTGDDGTDAPAPTAGKDDDILPVPPADKGMANGKPLKPGDKKKRFHFTWPPTRKGWLIIAGIAVLLIALGIGSWFVFFQKDPPKKTVVAVKKETPPPAPVVINSTLTGLPVPDAGVNTKQVTAIQIENSPDARPQSGLLQAGIVWEAIAEGGITRFDVLYQDTTSDYIGPVRSIRPYYIDWFLPFDGALAHAGGSPQGLADLKSLHAKDLDQFANSGAYQRISSRYAPHNLYTSIDKLNALEQSKGYTSSTYTGFARKKEAPLATPTAKSVDLAISSYYYNVHYDYVAASNSYNRSEGGAPHKDDKTGQQLSPKVVVAIVMGRGTDSDGQHTDYQTVGSGHMFVFQDGGLTEGTWSKASRQAQWKFTDANGKEIALNPGQTWFTMVDTPGLVTYKP